MQAKRCGVCNRDGGSMVELAEILMRPKGSAIIVTNECFMV